MFKVLPHCIYTISCGLIEWPEETGTWGLSSRQTTLHPYKPDILSYVIHATACYITICNTTLLPYKQEILVTKS